LGAAYFFTIGLLICGVGYLIAYGIHLLLGLEPPGESSFSFWIFLFIAWISTPYFGLTRGWRVMNRSTGWKFLAKWENNQSEDQPTSLENASMSEQGTNGLEIKTEFFPLALFLFFCTPRIEINGKVHEKPWGTHFFALPPGTHKITVYFPYKILGMERCGENSISVDVAKDVVTHVKYHMGTWMYSKGSLEVVNK
jgi:hypothetical protein